jgi:hypothetical protein
MNQFNPTLPTNQLAKFKESRGVLRMGRILPLRTGKGFVNFQMPNLLCWTRRPNDAFRME